MKLKFICVLICAIFFSCLVRSSSEKCLKSSKSSSQGLIYSYFTNGCLAGGSKVDLGELTLYPIFSKSKCCNDDDGVMWQVYQSGEMAIIERQYTNGLMCITCAYNRVDCLLTGYDCLNGINQQFFLQTYPSQIDFKNRRFYFSIHSKQYPSKCLTYEENPGNLVRSHYPEGVSDLKQDWHNSFRLANCTGDGRQSFYF